MNLVERLIRMGFHVAYIHASGDGEQVSFGLERDNISFYVVVDNTKTPPDEVLRVEMGESTLLALLGGDTR